MKTLKILKFSAALICAIFCTSCASSAGATRSFFAMDTYMEVTVYGSGAEQTADLCRQKVYELEDIFSAENGEAAVLNEVKSAKVSRELFELVSASISYNELTDGYFDITVRPLVELWGFNSDDKRVPSGEEISKTLALLGSDKISLEDGCVKLGNTSVDLGAVAKGYASNALRDICVERGAKSALIYLGGNVRTVGKKPDGSLWNIGIKDPEDASGIVGTVKVEDKAVITSGAYQRYFISDGRVYHHILDPHTGNPSDSGLASVTVISGDDALADALSTAIFAGGRELAEKLYNGDCEFEYVLIDSEKNVTVSEGLAKSFTLTNESYKTVP